jgi:hypothetical protein
MSKRHPLTPARFPRTSAEAFRDYTYGAALERPARKRLPTKLLYAVGAAIIAGLVYALAA